METDCPVALCLNEDNTRKLVANLIQLRRWIVEVETSCAVPDARNGGGQ